MGGRSDQVDLLIAHFGRPPTIQARGTNKQVLNLIADDRPRQVELMRLICRGIDRVDIHAPDGALLVQMSIPGHSRGDTPSDTSNRPRKRPKPASQQK